jgi:hypothetical protein
MARRRSEQEEGVSLFPFLSIIACVIGVLTLLISALSLAQMSGEDVASLEHFEKIQRELKEIREEIQRLKDQADEDALRNAQAMDERQRALAAARQRLDQLLQQIIELRKLLAQLEQEVKNAQDQADKGAPGKRDELAALKKKMTELEAELTSQKEQLAQLEKDLAQRKKPPEESEVSVLPSGSGKGFDPVFVECAGGAAILHHDEKLPRVRAAELAENEPFLKLLTEVAASPQKRVIFLVRDNGLNTYLTARKLADQHAAVHGALPVVGQGRLDLSHFNRSK